MELGFFVNTPAHAHLYREPAREMDDRGHAVTVFARDDSCTLDILDYYDIDYFVYGSRGDGRTGLVRELPGQLVRIARHVQTLDLDLIMGMGVYSTYAAVVGRVPAVTLMDSEPMAMKQRLTSPVVSAFLTPDAFTRDLGRNHFVFPGFKELAYLHPDIFEPDPSVREELGVDPREPFTIVRFNAFHAHHDVGKRGFTRPEKRELIGQLARYGTVFVSDEGENLSLANTPARRFDAHPATIHNALAEAKLLIADTQTMVTEAALLGTPAVRSNSFVGSSDMGNFRALAKAGLVFNRTEFEPVRALASELLERDDLERTWSRRRDAFLRDKCNLSSVLVSLLEDADSGDSIREAVDRHPNLRPRRTAPPGSPDPQHTKLPPVIEN